MSDTQNQNGAQVPCISLLDELVKIIRSSRARGHGPEAERCAMVVELPMEKAEYERFLFITSNDPAHLPAASGGKVPPVVGTFERKDGEKC